MRILVITQYFYPETFRINDIVKELVARGNSVTVVTGLPNYPEGKIFDGYENAYKETSCYFGAEVVRCKLRPRKKGSLNLALNYLSFVTQTNKVLKKIKPNYDVIYFYEPSPITSGFPALKYGKKHHIPTAIYNLDIWPDSVRDNKNGKAMSKKNPIYLIARSLSKKVYNGFNLIINKCDEFGDYLSKIFSIETKKMITVFEHAEDSYLQVGLEPTNNGIIDFVFLGNIGKIQNCDLIVKAFSKVKSNNILLHFVGDGSYLEELKTLVTELCLDNKVIFHGRHNLDEIKEFYEFADVCVLSLSNKTATGLTPPGKLASYMASGRPIIGAIDGSSQSIIKRAKCGFLVGSNDSEGLTKLMQNIADNPNILSGLGLNGRNFFLDNMTLKSHVDSIEKALLNLQVEYSNESISY